MLNWVRHAFAVESADLGPSPEEQLLIERLALAVVKRGLSAPALLALECTRNLNFVASQSVIFFSPLLSLVFDQRDCRRVAELLEHRSCVEWICRRIEQLAGEPAASPRDRSAPRSA